MSCKWRAKRLKIGGVLTDFGMTEKLIIRSLDWTLLFVYDLPNINQKIKYQIIYIYICIYIYIYIYINLYLNIYI